MAAQAALGVQLRAKLAGKAKNQHRAGGQSHGFIGLRVTAFARGLFATFKLAKTADKQITVFFEGSFHDVQQPVHHLSGINTAFFCFFVDGFYEVGLCQGFFHGYPRFYVQVDESTVILSICGPLQRNLFDIFLR